jgi:hypothetical protein
MYTNIYCACAPLPLDSAWSDFIDDLQNDDSVIEITKQIVHIDAIDVEGVDPHAQHALLASVSGVIHVQTGEVEGGALLLGQRQAVARVEQLGHKTQVQLLVAVHDVLGLQEDLAAVLAGVEDGLVGAVHHVGAGDGSAAMGLDLRHEGAVGRRVAHVRAEVIHLVGVAGLLQVVVHPAQQDGLGRQLHEGGQGLAFLQQHHELGKLRQRDVRGQLDLDDLPYQAKHQDGPISKHNNHDMVSPHQ